MANVILRQNCSCVFFKTFDLLKATKYFNVLRKILIIYLFQIYCSIFILVSKPSEYKYKKVLNNSLYVVFVLNFLILKFSIDFESHNEANRRKQYRACPQSIKKTPIPPYVATNQIQ